MGVLMLAVLTASAAAILAGLAIVKIGEWMRRPKAANVTAIVVTPLLFAAIVLPLMSGLVRATTRMEIAVSRARGDQVLSIVDVPPGTATDVCYRQSYVGCALLADFQMSEQDFLAWMKSQGWTVRRFTFKEDWESLEWDTSYFYDPLSIDGEVLSVREWEKDTWHYVKDGYMHYQAISDDSGRKIVYDLSTGRVYVQIC